MAAALEASPADPRQTDGDGRLGGRRGHGSFGHQLVEVAMVSFLAFLKTARVLRTPQLKVTIQAGVGISCRRR